MQRPDDLKKFFISAVLSILFCPHLFATHNRAAEITYRHIQGYTYEITIVTYTKLCMICPDRDYLDSVHLGDDAVTRFYRTSFTNLGDSIRVNKYMMTHTYPEAGTFRIYFCDPNRNEGIINVPNSVNVPLCIEAYLTAFDPSAYCINNSAVFNAFPYPATVGKQYNFNLAVTDIDQDSLSYELIPPLVSLEVPVSGYFLPGGFSLNPISGQITWGSPSAPGEYNFAVKVSEWRNDTIISYVMRDFQVEAFVDASPDTLNVFGPLSVATDASGNYFVSVDPGDTVNVQIVYYQSVINGTDIEVSGEAFLLPNYPAVQHSTGSGIATANLTWVPDSSQARSNPYIFLFNGYSSAMEQNMMMLMVYVNGGPADTCPDFTLPPEWIPLPFQHYDMHLFPSLVNESFTIILNRDVAEVSDKIKMFDALGRIVRVIDVTSPTITVQKSTLRKGLYFITLMDEADEVILYKKIIIY